MKKIINKVEDVALDMLKGIALSNPDVELDEKYKIIKRRDIPRDKVSLISGGGSGHEPAHAGFVGKGMLTAAVAGDVFASPSQIQVYKAITTAAGEKGVLLIIKNYSGDMMNFKNAAYMAQEDGIEVHFVRVNDDIAVEDSLYTVGRRGVAGTVFVHKIAGAAAEQGKRLDEVASIAQKAADNVRSIGIALTSCTVPANGEPTFSLEDDEIEYGVGIHGEPGVRREKIANAEAIAERFVSSVLDDLGSSADGMRVATMINGFGATPLMELYILNKYVTDALFSRGITISRQFVGNYMTSIDMAGASFSLLRLDEDLEFFLDLPASTAALCISGRTADVSAQSSAYGSPSEPVRDSAIDIPSSYARIGKTLTLENMLYLVDKMSTHIIGKEREYCDLDSHAGDGDFGVSVAKGFREVRREWHSLVSQSTDIGSFLEAVSLVIMEYCGGASGPIWGSAFRSAGKCTAGKDALSISEFADMMQAAVKGIQSTGERSFGRGAEVGDKTLMDALIPCADVWSRASDGDDFKEVFAAGAAAARSGAKATENIVARMGRAGTVGERSVGYPDAGAFALGDIFTVLSKSLN
jgi:dihydroxyacetone kinase